jgi:HlyD family secretion protein
MKRSLMAVALLVLVGVFAWAMWPKPVPVDVAVVTRGDVLVTVDEEGKTRIKDVYTVSAPISGKVLRRHLEPGDTVRKDHTVVATIEPTAPPFQDVRVMRELEAQAAAAKAAVALAEAEVRQAQSELDFAEAEPKERARSPDRSILPSARSRRPSSMPIRAAPPWRAPSPV